MGKHYLVGFFDNEDDILEATKDSYESGFPIDDVYTPYAVHHLDQAQGLKPSRLTYACFAFGAVGGIFMLFFQFWASAIDWPINVGGRPFNSLPAFIPVTFELVILFAGLGVVFTFFLVSKLYPGKKENQPDPSITNDRFAIKVEMLGGKFTGEDILRVWKKHHMVSFKDCFEED